MEIHQTPIPVVHWYKTRPDNGVHVTDNPDDVTCFACIKHIEAIIALGKEL